MKIVTDHSTWCDNCGQYLSDAELDGTDMQPAVAGKGDEPQF